MSKTLSQKQAKSLAVVYAAWRGANADNDIVGRIVWGKMLLKYYRWSKKSRRKEFIK